MSCDPTDAEKPPQHVLVVDDSRVSREEVARRLEAMGLQVTQASSGEQAFEFCLARDFDLVVSDLEMGGLSGVQLCRILRSDPETASTPFLLLTSRDDPRSRFWSRQAGASDHLSKMRMRQELTTRVEPLLRKGRDASPCTGKRRIGNPVARLNEVLERSLFEAVITAEARQLFELTGDRGTLGRAVLDLVAQLTRTSAASIELPTGGSPAHITRLASDLTTPEESALLRALGHPKDGLVLHEETQQRKLADPASAQARAFPLLVAGERLGSLKLLCDGAGLCAEDEGTARLLAAAVAPALSQLRLIEETQRLATTDELTGVNNRRETQRRLGHEVARAARYGAPLCLAMVDVDHFKRVNDSFGHSAGDGVLREVSAALKSGIRLVDLAGRWGGEEFLLVLSDTAMEGAALLADRLRRRVRLATTAADIPCHVTVSIGLAEFEPGLSAETLVDRADQALYRAKDGGRDRVVRYSDEPDVSLAVGA